MRSWTVFIVNWLLDFAFKFTDVLCALVSVLGAEKVHHEGDYNDLTRFPLHWISSVTRLFPTQILYCLNFSTIGESENIWERIWWQTHLTRLSFTSEQAQAQLNQPRHHKQIKHFDKCSVQCHWPHRWLCKKDISNASLIDSIFVFSSWKHVLHQSSLGKFKHLRWSKRSFRKTKRGKLLQAEA